MPLALPWTAISYLGAHREVTLVAGHHTDFPDAQVHRVARAMWGDQAARWWRTAALGYAEITYREFDRVNAPGRKGHSDWWRTMIQSPVRNRFPVTLAEEEITVARCQTRQPALTTRDRQLPNASDETAEASTNQLRREISGGSVLGAAPRA